MFPVHALEGCVWGRPLATRHARAYGLVTVFEKTDFPRFYCCAGWSCPCVGRPVRKAGSVCAKVGLRCGLLPRSDGACSSGREPLGRVRVVPTLWKRGTASQPARNTTRAGKRLKKRKGQGEEEGERVLQQHSRASTWPGHSRTRASGKRSLSPCLE